MHYVMIYGDRKVELIGPFDTADKAADYGTVHQAMNGDDPRWFWIELIAAGAYSVPIHQPSLAEMPGAYKLMCTPGSDVGAAYLEFLK